VSINTP